MSSAVTEVLAVGWRWPIDLSRYDRNRLLSDKELAALRALGWQVRRRHGYDRDAASWQVIDRLVAPLDDARAALGWLPDQVNHRRAITDAIGLVLHRCASENTSYWAWTPHDWARLIGTDRASFTAGWPAWLEPFTRPYVTSLAYLLCQFTNFELIGSYGRLALARRVFGQQPIQHALDEISGVLNGWGYRSTAGSHHGLRRILCEVLLLNRSPRLADLSGDTLLALRQQPALSRWNQDAIHAIHRAVAALGYTHPPAAPRTSTGPAPITGAAASWSQWVDRWAQTSTLTPKVRTTYRTILAKAGRWLAEQHPDITSPEQWTRQTCAAWLAAVDRLSAGDYVQHRTGSPTRWGTPLSARTKASYIKVVRVFLRDCQEWEWIPRRFDPIVALTTPRSIQTLIGPNPRVIADDIWAKLLWAGLNLKPEDITTNRYGFIYPVELVRAITLTWLFSGLRSDETTRLRLGCIRWQHHDVPIPGNSDQVLARDAICLLDLPVHKTGTAFTKPVDPLLGQAIDAWQSLRPHQPKMLDPKTGEQVDFLYAYRARRVGKTYINQTIIPMLCAKAGVPTFDVRGAITSHRARSTIATQLYNAKEPMTLFELQAWLGHRSLTATQHYAKLTPTTLAKAYSDAGYFTRNLRAIEVLIDRDAVTSSATAAHEPWQHYDLGHGYCGYTFFEQCPHRMACARCDFYTPKHSTKAELLEAKTNLQRMTTTIPLTDDELAAIQDGQAALDHLLNQLADTPTPAGPTPRQLEPQPTPISLPILSIKHSGTNSS
jgi:integrase